MQAIRFGLDLAKSVFQVHGVDASGQVVVQRQLRRCQLLKFFAKQAPALIGGKDPGFMDNTVQFTHARQVFHYNMRDAGGFPLVVKFTDSAGNVGKGCLYSQYD